MDFYKLFYFLTLGDRLSVFFFWAAMLCTALTFILILARILPEDDWWVKKYRTKKGSTFEENEEGNLVPSTSDKAFTLYTGNESAFRYYGLTKLIFPLTIFLWLLYIAIPSKKDAVLIIGGGYVGNFISQDSSAKQLPSDIVYFIRSNLQKYAEEAQVEIRGFTNTKTLADSLKEMSKEEITNYILNKTR